MKIEFDSLNFEPLLKKDISKEENPLKSFSNLLEEAISEVNTLQNRADQMMEKLATGEVKDLHQVMIALEEANLALQLTLQIRNKVIEAYQEIMRMQI
jgi:flagellar hook-basal body complex protein FliE